MTPDRVADLFAAVLEQPPGARRAFLDDACTDAEQDEIDALLQAYDRSDEFLEPPSAEDVAALVASEEADRPLPERIGPYRVIREVGHGGQGRVLLAERADGQFERTVAIKLLRDTGAWGESVARFLRERQILAALDHPAIARLYDGGVTDAGQPWFAMEYVAGEAITTYCKARDLDLEARLRLFAEVVEAVGHAHRHHVVHRDLKPANILVTAEGRVKLLDFGIAKPLAQPDEEKITRTTSRVMTPAYAAPEQVRGGAIGPPTDVYALGAVLYELVTGQRAQQFTSYAPDAIARVVCDVDPVRPSKVDRRLRGDLDAIVLKALRKEPVQRYASVYAMLDDLSRYRDGLPVTARRGSLVYRLRKTLRRHRLQVAAAVLVVALAGALLELARARSAAAAAASARDLAARTAQERDGITLNTVADSAEARAALAMASGRHLAFMTNRAGVPFTFDFYAVDGDSAVRLVENVERPSWAPDGSRVAFQRDGDIYSAAADGSDVRQLTSGPAREGDAMWSPDGRRIAFASDRTGNQEVFLMNPDGTGLVNLTRHPDNDVHPSWSPDGRFIVFDTRREGHPEIYIMRSDGSEQRNLTRHPQVDIEPAWSPDGTLIAFVSMRDGGYDVWVMQPDGSNPINLTPHPAGDGQPGWSPDGKYIVFTSDRRGDSELYLMRRDGTVLANITHTPGVDMFPTWRR